MTDRVVDGIRVTQMAATVAARDVARHVHEDAHYVLVLEGAYLSSAAAAPSLIERPSLIFNPPGTTHRDRFLSPRGRFLAISFALDEGGAEFARHCPARACLQGREAESLALAIAREMTGEDDCAHLAVAALCRELFAATAGRTPIRSRHAPGWVVEVCEYVCAHFAARLDVTNLARQFDLTPAELARGVRRHLGRTMGALQREARDAAAIAQVRKNDASLAEIAARCGYSDQSHMNRALRLRTGQTPTALRSRS